MSYLSIDTSTALKATVSGTKAALGTALVSGQLYVVTSSTNAWFKQGTCLKITCVTKANTADSDFITVAIPGSTVVYEFDVAGDGVTAGRVQVNISTDTTAANVAARLRTAILANQAALEVIDNADGTLTVCLNSQTMSITENVANAGFTITTDVVTATVGNGSTLVTPNVPLVVDGLRGPQGAVIQDAAGGNASITRAYRV